MVRSKSRSKSSRSRSKSRSSSRSRSRSRSRKKRYSSRSRSRSYSRSRSRDRNHPRDYRRDFRVNRGMRRPYGFRNRGRGYYQGGRFHRGGFRPNWQNRRYSRSPRRGRSRSRTPKRRSASQRSRSKSHPSGRSSASRCSTSPSSSPYSRSPGPSSGREARSKATKQAEGVKVGVRPLEAEKGDGRSGQPVPVSSAKPEPKGPGLVSEGWMGISAYGDNSPRRSPSPVPTAPQISPGSHLSLCSRPMQRDSPAPCPSPGRSPGKAFSVPLSNRGLFPSADDQNLPKPGRYFKRFLDEDNGKGNGRDGVPQTDRVKGEWGDKAVDLGVKTKAEKVPFLGDSPEVEEEDESQAYRQPYQFKVASQTEARKSYSAEPRWPLDGQEEAGKYKAKSCTVGRELDRFGEDGAYKFKEPGYGPEWLNKGKGSQEGQGAERLSLKQLSAEREREQERLRLDFLNKGPLLQSSLDMRNKASLREENTARVKITPTEGSRPQVQIKILPVALDGTSPGTSAISDRSVASALALSAKRVPGFRSIFDHIKRPQAYKSSAQSFIHHIVSLVHSVREHYFKSAELSLHERFTVYQKAAVENEAGHKSPEIHRRIDIAPTVFKKSGMLKEDRKGEKKVRHVSASLRHDNDRRRTDRSCGRDDSRGSREPSPPRKADKVGKEPKDYKDHKPVKGDSKHKSKEREHSGSSSESSVSREEGKAHPEGKDYVGFQGGTRARGTFQFRIRGGRGRGRGVFSGPIPVPVAPGVPFQKRPKDEEWDPEYTPKSRKYFLHDDRDDGTDYWAKRGRGRGVFQRGRGCFPFKKSSSSPKWTHDKYQCEGTVEEEEEETTTVCEERKDKQKEEKVE